MIKYKTMGELQRVDIKIDKELLKFAGAKAALAGISRRQYLADILTQELILLKEVDEYVHYWSKEGIHNRITKEVLDEKEV